MTSKDCGHDDDDRKGAFHRLIGGILTFIVLFLLVVFIIWLVLRPTKPRFVLQDATVYAFNVTAPNLLTATFQVTLSSRNPNERIGVYYERLDVHASYRNQQITLPTRMPYTYQGHKDVTIWSPFLYGNNVPIAPFLGVALQQDQNAGFVIINVKVNGRVKWKVGTWVSGRYHLNANCPAYLSFGNNNNKGNAFNNIGSAIKFQISSSCHVDVAI
ncbi:NDR1/HIN1-like protein 1 [Chenopodium quinoa]|uniref:Late embryogenesis abundant protein LEA-2 subgroup domain-containing protein n=1 Tax=Chenopodium quinoa TaxID=63459 RepID=A0A803LXP0_CHEQI|nr:NDR1/HIN1-like protein 1 [Chenopodium quinoa]